MLDTKLKLPKILNLHRLAASPLLHGLKLGLVLPLDGQVLHHPASPVHGHSFLMLLICILLGYARSQVPQALATGGGVGREENNPDHLMAGVPS